MLGYFAFCWVVILALFAFDRRRARRVAVGLAIALAVAPFLLVFVTGC
ncbi:hypothetical protein [Lacticaseibacillus daqingensis]|nr:hypothetical protein [Lacticaseibacillus daqingensis]